jgi:hypothetical protein
MELRVEVGRGQELQVLFPIVFETQEHFLDFTTVARVAQGVQEVFRGSTIACVGKDIPAALVFGSTDSGPLRQWLGKRTKELLLMGAGFAAEQFADGFIEAATGKTFYEWGSSAGEIAKSLSEEFGEEVSDFTRAQLQAALIETELCRKFLEIGNEELDSLLSERPDAASTVLNGRRQVYEACRANQHLPSLRFGTSSSSAQILRSEFGGRARRSTLDSTPHEVQTSGEWKSAILRIEVTSPNWDRLDQQRGWKGRLEEGKYIYFHISDSRFWRNVADGSLKAEAPDRLTAQILYQDVGGRFKNADAIRVLEFNGSSISEALPNSQMESRLRDLETARVQIERPLFEIDPRP